MESFSKVLKSRLCLACLGIYGFRDTIYFASFHLARYDITTARDVTCQLKFTFIPFHKYIQPPSYMCIATSDVITINIATLLKSNCFRFIILHLTRLLFRLSLGMKSIILNSIWSREQVSRV